MRLLLVLLLSLLVLPAAAQEWPTQQQVAQRAITEVFRPGFAAFAEATHKLGNSVDSLCATPSSAALTAAQESFRSTVLAWSRVELFRLGPLLVDNRSDAILFWPDRKGIALRQVQAVLAAEDSAAADADLLAGKSVAMQGLGALEYLLFGTDADTLATGTSYRCSYAAAITGLLHQRAEAIAAEWNDPGGFSKRLLDPTADDPDYRDAGEVQNALVGLLAHGSEAIRDQRLLPFLGREGAAPKPRSALFWRSGMSIPSVTANLQGLRTLLDGSRIFTRGGLPGMEIADNAHLAFDDAEQDAGQVVDPLDVAVADPTQRAALDDLVAVTQELGTAFGEELATALDLSVGFSSLDGD